MSKEQNLEDKDKALHIGGVSISLFQTLNKSIQDYVNIFCKKHDLYFEFWVADLAGTIGCFSNEYYVDFETIRLDLEKDADKNVFFDWYEITLELGMKDEPIINYYSYLKTIGN